MVPSGSAASGGRPGIARMGVIDGTRGGGCRAARFVTSVVLAIRRGTIARRNFQRARRRQSAQCLETLAAGVRIAACALRAFQPKPGPVPARRVSALASIERPRPYRRSSHRCAGIVDDPDLEFRLGLPSTRRAMPPIMAAPSTMHLAFLRKPTGLPGRAARGFGQAASRRMSQSCETCVCPVPAQQARPQGEVHRAADTA
jgi:hypothetical protein